MKNANYPIGYKAQQKFFILLVATLCKSAKAVTSFIILNLII